MTAARKSQGNFIVMLLVGFGDFSIEPSIDGHLRVIMKRMKYMTFQCIVAFQCIVTFVASRKSHID